MTLGESFDGILAAARTGEDWAWARLYQDLAGPVRGYLAGRGSPDPEDEAADTFLHIARGLSTFKGGEPEFRAWVFSIAHRRMVDAHRKASRRPQVSGEEPGDATMRDVVPSAEQQALLRDEAKAASELLEGLSRDQREILLLRVVGELSVRETAEVMGKSESAVKVSQHRAIQALRVRLARRM